MAAYEKAALWAWPPREAHWLNGWLLRAGGAASRRVNSVQTLTFVPDQPVAPAIITAELWYAARDLPACFQLCDAFSPAALDDDLSARGYARLPAVSVLTGQLAPGDHLGDGVELIGRPTAAVMNVLSDPHWSTSIRVERASLLGRIRRPHVFAVAWVHGEPAAGGLCVVDGDLAGILSMRTQAPFRRRGLARSVLSRLTGWAAGMGAKTSWLQVEDHNVAASRLYEGACFTRCYGYWYREQAGLQSH